MCLEVLRLMTYFICRWDELEHNQSRDIDRYICYVSTCSEFDTSGTTYTAASNRLLPIPNSVLLYMLDNSCCAWEGHSLVHSYPWKAIAIARMRWSSSVLLLFAVKYQLSQVYYKYGVSLFFFFWINSLSHGARSQSIWCQPVNWSHATLFLYQTQCSNAVHGSVQATL